ncbi:reverse transcriptase domain-containing protein [Tanacetum coccineum]
MSTHEQHTPTVPTSAVRNTGGRSGPQGLEEPTPDEVLRELCDKNYHQLLPLIAEKMQKEKEQQDKLNATPTDRTEPERRHGNRRSRSPSPVASVFKRLKQNRPPSPRPRPRKEGGVFNRLGGKEQSASARSDSRHQGSYKKETEVQPRKHHHRGTSSWETGGHSESEHSEGGHWKSKSRRHSHVKTYDGSGDPKDHLKLFQAAAKTERWAMPTWCHMFNSTLTGIARVWFDKLLRESIDSYEDLRTTFRENYLQQTKHIKDPVEIHHIKQRDGESTEDFMERYKPEILDVEGAPECMKISGFMHGEVAEFSHSRKKAPMPWKQPEGGHKPNFKKGFKNKQISDWNPDRFSLLTKTPKETFALEKGKFKAPPPMVTPTEKRDPNKYCELHVDTGHCTDECMHLRKKIDEMIKSVKGGAVTLRSSRVIPMECAMISGPSTQPPIPSQVLEEKAKVAIHLEYLEQTIAIGSTLTEKGRAELCALLRQNLDVFAWRPADMTKEEVEKLVDAEIIKEVHYHSWLSNPVMVKKHDGSWRMCVDFKDLNQACPKDGYPLLEIDWKVESLCGYPFKCFLDAYKGYHQIKMAMEDEEKIAFITSQGIFYYLKMSFGLKNVGVTYQRLVDKAFQKQIGRNLEVYVNDLVTKSHTEEEIILDIEETFKTLRQINMKLNPKKCTFVMQEGMFLGYKVNADRLKVCPDKADAALSLPSPRCLKDVQKLNGKLERLNRFLSKSAEKSLPFFKTLKKCTKKDDFQWTQEAEVAFKQIKKLIAELPMLNAPKEKKELIMYLAAAKEAISAVLMTERGGKQLPVYFMSHALRGSEINYTPMEKLVLDLLSASRRLKRWVILHRWFGAGLILTNPKGVEFTYAMRFRFEATNNEAEYEALIAGLRIAEQMGIKNLQVNVDSRLVANQVNGSYVAKESGQKGTNSSTQL